MLFHKNCLFGCLDNEGIDSKSIVLIFTFIYVSFQVDFLFLTICLFLKHSLFSLKLYLGYVESDGKFIVEDVVYYESGPQTPLKSIEDDQFILLMSGINFVSRINFKRSLCLTKPIATSSPTHVTSVMTLIC